MQPSAIERQAAGDRSMQKIQITQFLMIASAVALMGSMPVMADMLSTALPADEQQSSNAGQNVSLDPQDFPRPVQAGSIVYITGGIGDDERVALEAVRSSYNLHVLNASKAGEYLCDTHLVIRDRHGAEILGTSAGPIFLASLPAGTYTLAASRASQSQMRHVTIGGTRKNFLNLIWD